MPGGAVGGRGGVNRPLNFIQFCVRVSPRDTETSVYQQPAISFVKIATKRAAALNPSRVHDPIDWSGRNPSLPLHTHNYEKYLLMSVCTVFLLSWGSAGPAAARGSPCSMLPSAPSTSIGSCRCTRLACGWSPPSPTPSPSPSPCPCPSVVSWFCWWWWWPISPLVCGSTPLASSALGIAASFMVSSVVCVCVSASCAPLSCAEGAGSEEGWGGGTATVSEKLSPGSRMSSRYFWKTMRQMA
mmetsp:Transcript_39011/g.111487  ORF Transcript_39011/g.111487 Transcript_39011/m.111487 type:complete len:242 (+) Transcript_39011:1963-2688(+)